MASAAQRPVDRPRSRPRRRPWQRRLEPRRAARHATPARSPRPHRPRSTPAPRHAVTMPRGGAAATAGSAPGARDRRRRSVPVAATAGTSSAESVHTVDADGYRTAFSSEPPPPPPRPGPRAARSRSAGSSTSTTPTSSDGYGSSLPAYGDVDAGWLGVLCARRRPGKGLVALPDVGDTVVVALPHGVPTPASCSASLYGTLTPPDPGVAGGRGPAVVAAHRGRPVDRAGRRGALDPAREPGRQRSSSSRPTRSRLHAATDLVLDAPGHGDHGACADRRLRAGDGRRVRASRRTR